MLQLKNITKDYVVGDQTIHALRGISIDFRRSEFVSILGPSGCGKTTLMNIVGGLDKYTSGDLFIDGKSTKDFSDRDWDNYRNKKIGFIFQSYNLIPHLSVLGNVELALTISGISKKERRASAIAALTEVGLSDRMNQKPNQLSGGQMQRVAIARALVNSPEILLADEPTGALDSDTSEQIMALIKKIAENRLVIMVTHNPELAERYSTRTVNMIDGKVTADSDEYYAEDDLGFLLAVEKSKAAQPEKKNQSAMAFTTALSLSGRNLVTKKGRTILTAVAGSIGIIGIALILALSSGMNAYVSQLQSDMLSSTPISISASSFDMTQAMTALGNQDKLAEYPDAKEIYVQKAVNMASLMKKNNITEEYVNHVKTSLDAAWYNDIMYKTGLDMRFYGKMPGQANYTHLKESGGTGGGMGGMMQGGSSVWQMMLKSNFVKSQYDVLGGNYPADKNELAIIVGSTNEISESTLLTLGLMNVGDEVTKYGFDDIIGKEYKAAANDLLYAEDASGGFWREKAEVEIDFNAAQTLKISGVLRIKESAVSGSLSAGIGYTSELYNFMQTENEASGIVQFMKDNPTLDPLKGTPYLPTLTSSAEELRENDFRAYGGGLIPNEISIYPVSYETKTLIKEALDAYNTGKAEQDIIIYSDMAELLGDTITSIIDVITYVLIAFTAISLVVSSIMIAIITYVSVLERTKEIGILRSIGARKKDITRVFNAETFIIGLIAGVLGVGFTYLLSVPINLIVGMLLGVTSIASLGIGYAALLVGISVALTVVAGLIPARGAAKKDPVTALRTE